jgi:hypothetical protein
MVEASAFKDFVVKFASPGGRSAVVIDDDGRVGYAYLLDAEGKICGDVWLYNRCPTPIEPEWTDREKAPFANPQAYVDATKEFALPASAGDVSVDWCQSDGACEARVFIHGRLAAKLVNGAKPGWSALARQDGPLAKVFRP